MRFVKSIAAAAALAVSALSAGGAAASVVSFGDPAFPSVTVAPGGFTAAFYSDDANTDVGNQSPANVLAVMQAWFGDTLTFVGGGACGAAPVVANNCSAFDNGGGNSNKGGASNLTAQLFAVHFGNRFIAFLYGGPVNGFEINGLRFGVSNIYAFNGEDSEIPLPGAVWLMGAGLAGLSFARRRKAAI
ncbi:MAG TPA: hypothetical protein DDZ68_06130 [Parvularcula sp.]|nr:hypothetical protein [Parvularcula sp.]HBS32764.1 hypothetical protein [Parvularcula sp.]HBS36216.1 hypothetical protein [Parvularcula sp.]